MNRRKVLGVMLAGAGFGGVTLALGGCEGVAYVADSLGMGSMPVNVKAEYKGLENQSVAVLVSADLSTLNSYPACILEVCTAVSEGLAKAIPTVRVVRAQEVVDFQEREIYWHTYPYSKLAKRLGVTRIMLIDLVEFRSHEPGNQYVFKAVIQGKIGLAETDSTKPDDRAYETVVQAEFPPGKGPASVRQNEDTVKMAALHLFQQSVVYRFYDHKEERR